jgi:hypothetical protein
MIFALTMVLNLLTCGGRETEKENEKTDADPCDTINSCMFHFR